MKIIDNVSILLFSAIGIVAAGRIHSGFVKPGMSITFGPNDINTKVIPKFYAHLPSTTYNV